MSSLNQEVLSQLDEQLRTQLMQFVEGENAKLKVQMAIHQFTDMCFKKCVPLVLLNQLVGGEEQCLHNCVNRFLDTNIRVVEQLQRQAQ